MTKNVVLNEKNNNTDVVDRVNLISKSKSKKMSNIKAKQSEYLDEMNKLNYAATNYKKAIVTLSEGDSIDFYSNI